MRTDSNKTRASGITYAYTPCSADWQHPVDRRRFPRYCQLTGIPLATADWKHRPDVLIVTQAADLTYCSRIGREDCLIVFDANDGYLIPRKRNFFDRGRGLFKFIVRQHKYPEAHYERTYLRMCERADAVVCSHPLQAAFLRHYCKNVHLITDFPPNIELKRKRDYSIKGPINVFWEGLGTTRNMPFSEINRIFGSRRDASAFRFHLLTDLELMRVSNHFFGTTVMDECRRKAPDLFKQFYFYQWNELVLSEVATKCDFGIIPIPLDNTARMFKPENKLVLMWRMGIPTIVSATPSYAEAMTKVGCNLACFSDAEWQSNIDRLLENEELRRTAGEDGYRHVELNYSENAMRTKWDKVLASIGALPHATL